MLNFTVMQQGYIAFRYCFNHLMGSAGERLNRRRTIMKRGNSVNNKLKPYFQKNF